MDLNEVASQLEKKAVASRSFGGVIKAGEYAAWAKECKAIAEEHYESLRAEKKAFIEPVTNFLSGAYNQASDALKKHVSNPLAHRALMGAGLGAGGGALLGLGSNLVSGRKKKNYLSDMLHYGLLGGLGGGAAGGLYELATNPKSIESIVGEPASAEAKPPETKKEEGPKEAPPEIKKEKAPEAAPPAAGAAVPPGAKKEKAPEATPPVAAAPAPEAKPKLNVNAIKQKIEANETLLGRLGEAGTEDVLENAKDVGVAGAAGAAGGVAAGRSIGAGKQLISDALQRNELRGLKSVPLAESKGFQEALLNRVKEIQQISPKASPTLGGNLPFATNYEQARNVARDIIQNPSKYNISGDALESIMQYQKGQKLDPRSVLGALGHDTDIAKSLQKALETGDTATRLKAFEEATKATRSGKLPSVMLDEPYLSEAQKSFRKSYGPGSAKGLTHTTELGNRLFGSSAAKTLGRYGGRAGALVGAGAVLTDLLTGKNTPSQTGQIVSNYIQDIISKNPNMSMDTFKTLQDYSATAAKGLSKLDASAILDQISKLGK